MCDNESKIEKRCQLSWQWEVLIKLYNLMQWILQASCQESYPVTWSPLFKSLLSLVWDPQDPILQKWRLSASYSDHRSSVAWSRCPHTLRPIGSLHIFTCLITVPSLSLSECTQLRWAPDSLRKRQPNVKFFNIIILQINASISPSQHV